ncbi:glycosyltransferase [Tautonia sociabilis]|uniref:Glycosyltransferase family 4 protein n=1 Tax=Tautonia sociabilis TaxID=2080755 RepID=A0A432MGD8_9BACT|nr:glycosyltransferase [Tautonia sociabilis]RUL85712.1 glycosyltransferase family 4 protein [Tautonia sociabilis]
MEAGPHVQLGSPTAPRRSAEARVALVHDWLTGMRGGEKCLEVLCQAFPNAPLFTLIHRRGATSPAIEAMDIRTSPLQRLPGVFRHYRHLLPLMPMAARSWRLGPVDVVVSLSHCVAKAVRVPRGVPHLCYCFTPMRYAWDGRAAYLDGWLGKPVRRAMAGAALDRLRSWDRQTAAGVTQFVAISETVRRRIARCYGRDSRVIPPPVDTRFYTPDPSSRRDDGPYLCVSALVPYKKLEHAVLACSSSGRPLVVIGSGPERPKLERLAGPTVRFLGWQPDEVIRDHYRRCRALLFPGEEDFGIVPAEALACGAPVIALGRGGVAETVDDRVGLLYDEPGPGPLLRAIEAFEADGGRRDASLARLKAEALSPDVFRERLLLLLDELLDNRSPIPPPHLPRRVRSRSSPEPAGSPAGWRGE